MKNKTFSKLISKSMLTFTSSTRNKSTRHQNRVAVFLELFMIEEGSKGALQQPSQKQMLMRPQVGRYKGRLKVTNDSYKENYHVTHWIISKPVHTFHETNLIFRSFFITILFDKSRLQLGRVKDRLSFPFNLILIISRTSVRRGNN